MCVDVCYIVLRVDVCYIVYVMRVDVCYIVYVMRVDTERDACTPVVVLLCVRWDDAADSYTML